MQIQPRNLVRRCQDGSQLQLCVPQVTFIEDAYRRAVSGTLAGLEGDGDAD